MTAQLDLFAVTTPECAACPNLGAAIDSGIRYCRGDLTWRWATERVEGCRYRDRVSPVWPAVQITRADCIRDLLESPRHDIDPKGRAWLQSELRKELAV